MKFMGILGHWINFIALIFINEKKRYFRCLYRIWNKIISFYMRKKGNIRQIIEKMKKKVNLKVLGASPYVSKGVPQSWLDPNNFLNYDIYFIFITKYFSTQGNDTFGWDFIVPS
jgi:hypothetical protein